MAEEQNKHTFVGSIIRGDNWIWGIYVVLLCISIVEIFSATAQLTYRSTYASDPAFSHIKNLLGGLVMLLLSQSMSLKSIRAWDKLFYVGGFLLFCATIMFGVAQKGAARSIAGIQPVEVCKLGVIMLLCSAVTAPDSFYHKIPWFRTNTRFRRYVLYLVLIALEALPVATQNLSSGLIICMASFGIMFLGQVRGKYLTYTLLIGLGLGIAFLGGLKWRYEYLNGQGVDTTEQVAGSQEQSGWNKLTGRVDTWAGRVWDHSDRPLWEEDMGGKKSQEIYSHMAIANGYPLGQFIGGSRLRDFLPEAFSDYIYAIIFEEWGFIPAAVIPLLYLLLFIRCFILSRRTENLFVRLLILGLPLIICIQALIHIGVCTGAMFVTGQPLPLISRGGSSVMGTSISFGIMLALSRIIRQEQLNRQAQLQEEAIDQPQEEQQLQIMN